MGDFAARFANGAVMAAPANAAYAFGTGDFTLEVWFRTTSPGTLISRKATAGGAGNGGFLLVLDGSASLKFATDSGFGFYEIRSVSTSALDGAWHHAAAVRTGGALAVYLDGSLLQGSIGSNTGTPCNVDNGQRLLLAGTDQQQEPFNRFPGSLDGVRVWNLARSAEEIRAAMNGRLSGLEPGLVGYWTFNGRNGADASRTRNDAVAEGEVAFVFPGAPTDRVATVANGLVGYYPLLADGLDYSGNLHHGSPGPGVSFGAGLFGGSATITAGEGITFPTSLPRYADHFTLAAWVSLSSAPPADTAAESAIAGRLTARRDDGRLTFYFYYDSPSSADNQMLGLRSERGLGRDEWHHVAVVYNHDDRKLAFYIDRDLVNVVDLSGRVGHDDRPHLPWYPGIGGASGFIGVLNGSVSDVFLLDVTCEKDDINFLGGTITPQVTPAPRQEEVPEARSLASTGQSCAPSWWAVIPVVGWIALQQAANCSARPADAPPPASEIATGIYSALQLTPPAPIPAGQMVSRSDIELAAGVRVHVDVGGEGPIDSSGIRSGFRDSINLQAADGGVGDGTHQTQPPNDPIPNLVRMASWSQAYPFADGFADYVTMQNAPLTQNNVDEIVRVINPDTGEIALWVDVEMWQDNIETLASRLKARILWNDTDEFHGQAGAPKTTLVLGYDHDEL